MKNKKTTILIFLVLLVVGCFSFQVMGGTMRAVNSEAELIYAALNCDDGETIMLLSDIKLNETLVFSCGEKTVTLDLAGRKLEAVSSDGDGLAMDGENCVLIIKDSKGKGRLQAESTFDGELPWGSTAGIRVLNKNQTLIIDSGEVRAKGGSYGAGIGGGINQLAGNIIVKGGDIEATGGGYASGIGTGGFEAFGASAVRDNQINIYGGNIKATGGVNAAGIGGGQYQRAATVRVFGGRLEARGGASGAGIGSGSLNFSSDEGESYSGDIVISGGNVKAVGGENGAGIGTGEGTVNLSGELQAKERSILLEGGNVIAFGGSGGAGVGGGAFMSGGKISLLPAPDKSLYLEAAGGTEGAGIGGGKGGSAGAAIMVGGGSITAKGGENAAGIGTGGFGGEYIQPTAPFFWSLKNVVLSGGQVKAYGGANGAAIGGGSGGAGVDLKIYGEPIVEAVSSYEITIGGGAFSYDHGSCTIDGGNVIISNEMGPQPKNSGNRNIYLGVLTLVTEEEGDPVTRAAVEVISDERDTYRALADEKGMVYMYLPEDLIGLSLVTGFGEGLFGSGSVSDIKPENRVTGQISITADNKAAASITLPNEEPLKILAEEHTYYLGDINTFELPYRGSLKGDTAFSIIHNESKMEIDKKTGLLTIPVHIEAGEHNFTILAWKNGEVTDSRPFTLHVKDTLTAITPSIREIVTEPGRESLISFETYPDTAEILYSDWRLIYGSEEDCRLTVIPDENGRKMASFNGGMPGVYVLMAAAQDVKGNKAWDTVHITVAEPAAAVFGETGKEAEGEIIMGAVSAWSVNRTSPETAELSFFYEGKGPWGSLIIENERTSDESISEEEFSEEGFLKIGENTVSIKGLEEGKDYRYFVKVWDGRRNEQIIGEFTIPKFIPPDIFP